MNKLELPRDEMAFRKECGKQVMNQSLKTIFRPGNRIFPKWRGYKKGEIVTARIIDQLGNDSELKHPIFTNYKKKIKIKNISLIDVADLTEKDLLQTYSHVKTVDDLKKHLFWVYNKSLEEYNNIITKIDIEYLN